MAPLLNAHVDEDFGEKGLSTPDVSRHSRKEKEGIPRLDRRGKRCFCLEIDIKAKCTLKVGELSRLRAQEDCATRSRN